MRVQLFKTIARARRPQPAVVDTSTHTVLKAVSRDVCEETGSYLESVSTYGRSYDIKTYLRHDGVEMPTGATAYLN